MATALAPVQPDETADPLPGMAERIYEKIQLSRRASALVLDHARAAGELLEQAKSKLPHGQWLPWLKQHDFDPSTAAYYRGIAKYFYFFRQQMDRDPNVLPIREARRLLKDCRAAEKAGLTELPERTRPPRRHTLVRMADQIRRYNQHEVRGRREMLLDLRAAIDAALKKAR